ncbi:hypothetical protein [Streptomyces sp. NPDC046925]|uniref:hypothetical protein n=1 Tax=Streptomyces sp. NPDC046925 TaxID=3155375 RepID=UPI0033E1F496
MSATKGIMFAKTRLSISSSTFRRLRLLLLPPADDSGEPVRELDEQYIDSAMKSMKKSKRC